MVRAAPARCCPRLGHALQPHAGGDGGGAPGRLPPLLRLLRDCLVLLLPGRLRGWLRGWRRLLGRLLRPGGARGEVAWTLHVEARSVAPPGGAVWLGGESGGERGEHCGCLHELSLRWRCWWGKGAWGRFRAGNRTPSRRRPTGRATGRRDSRARRACLAAARYAPSRRCSIYGRTDCSRQTARGVCVLRVFQPARSKRRAARLCSSVAWSSMNASAARVSSARVVSRASSRP